MRIASLAVFGLLIALTIVADAAGPTSVVLGDEQTNYDLSTAPANVVEDPSGELGVDEVARGNDFRAFSRVDSSGAKVVTEWLRFSAIRPAGSAIAWYLVVSAGCTSADLYEPDIHGGFDHRSFGWSTPYSQHPYPGTSPAIELQPASLTGQVGYLRLTCYRSNIGATISSKLSLTAKAGYAQENALVDVAMVTFAILGIAFSLMTRERIYLLSSGPPLTLTIFDYFVDGHFSRLLPELPMPPFWWTYAITNAIFCVAQWAFIRAFLELPTRMKWIDRLFSISFVVKLAATVAIGVGYYDGVVFAITEVVFYGIPLVGGIIAWRNGSRRARFFVAGLGAVMLGFIAYNLQSAGVHIAPPAVVHVLDNWNIPFESLMLFVGIADRFRRTVLENRDALAANDAAKSALVDQQQAHISEIERRNVAFSRFVPQEFLRQLNRKDVADIELGDHSEHEMSILFSDIRGFTTLVEALSPGETFTFLNGYLKLAGPAIRQSGGFIDKYIGDAIMALFPRDPADAVEAALLLQREVRRLNDVRARRSEAPIAIGIGINYGTLMLGTIGESERIETTVLADAVNMASRLEGLTKRYGAGIIAGEAFIRALPQPNDYHIRPLGVVQLKGFKQTVAAYEIFDGDASELLLHKIRTIDDFETALTCYREGRFVESSGLFDDIVRANAHDRGALWLRDRSKALAEATDLVWDGIDRLDTK